MAYSLNSHANDAWVLRPSFLLPMLCGGPVSHLDLADLLLIQESLGGQARGIPSGGMFNG
jgi:hypothetical protein